MGPEIRFWYLVTTADPHPQAFCASFSQPQGQAFIAAANWKSAKTNDSLADFVEADYSGAAR